MQGRRFIDANVFINWLKAKPALVLKDETALISGYILYKIEKGEEALTTVTVKDEVALWLSRYNVNALNMFLTYLPGYTTLEIATPSLTDQIKAGKLMGKYKLGYSDLVTLQVMKRHGISEIYSSDTGFDTVPEIKRIFDELKEEDGYNKFLCLLQRGTKMDMKEQENENLM